MSDLHFVRCDRARWDGSPCMTVYPANSPTHEGPCLYCWNDMQAKRRVSGMLDTLVAETPSLGRFDEPEEYDEYID